MGSISVIAGCLKGRKIRFSRGREIRPMSARVRAALFNVLARDIQEARFLDLFAGSGAVGIEAFSRGAAEVCFVERDSEDLKAALQDIGIDEEVEIISGEAETCVRDLLHGGRKFDIIVLDPPYQVNGFGLIEEYHLQKLLSGNGVLVYSHSSRDDRLEKMEGLVLEKERPFGDTVLSVYIRRD